MPEHYRALIVILILSTFVFTYFKKHILLICNQKTYTTWRNYWFLLTLAAFLSNNFWIFMLLAGVILAGVSRTQNRVALFILLVFTIPPFSHPIPGFGLVNFLIEINHIRLLALTLLVPTLITLRQQENYQSFGKLMPDKLLLAYLCLVMILSFRDTSVTEGVRQSLYLVLDIFLPYMVISRYVNTLQKFKETLLAFVTASLIMATVSIFELLKNWLLYSSLNDALGVQWGFSSYLGRSAFLRSSASAAHPIALGFIMTTAIGFYLFLQNVMPKNLKTKTGSLVLLGGLIAPLSRGPWVGAGVLFITFILSGKNVLKKLTTFFVVLLLSFSVVSIMPGGNKIIDLLPFIGQNEKGNLDYRENLLDVSIIVIKKNLAFGSLNFLETPEMQTMVQGQGMIDIVNSYIAIALVYGLVGLTLFVSYFFVVLLVIRAGMKTETNENSEYYLLGRVMLCTLISILVIIYTVSSISFIPIVYWSISALGVAYYQMMRHMKKT